MGDFFSRLAEKALGVAPAVKPDLTPIFAVEPQTESVARAILQEEQETAFAPAARMRPPLDSHEEIVQANDAQAQVAPRRANSPAAAETARQGRSAEIFADAVATPADQRSLNSTASPSQVFTRDHAESPITSRTSDATVNLTRTPIGMPSAQPVMLSEQSVRISEAPIPTIKVNIGRVEVRAVVAPSAGPKSVERIAPERQTLEQYLRARNERRR
jgi:hypothetical protein